jgi:hypothetical protein
MSKQELLTKVFFERGYSITDEGKVFNPKGEERKLGKTKDGYYSINLRLPKGNSTRVFIHKIQAFKKFGDKIFEQDIVIRHLNGISTNNTWENIGIGSQSDNLMDIPKVRRRELSSNPKYNHLNIIRDREKGFTYKELMLKYNISSTGTLSFIINKSIEKENKLQS